MHVCEHYYVLVCVVSKQLPEFHITSCEWLYSHDTVVILSKGVNTSCISVRNTSLFLFGLFPEFSLIEYTVKFYVK